MSSQTRLMPPLAPCSDEDVASFAALLIHLRSQPELARENEKLLNAEALAHITEGARAFQHAHLGRQARAMQWPLVRIPDEIFRDRSRSGPLFTALLAAYREKNSSSWRTFDLASPKRYNDNIDILRRMEKELTAAGFLRRPAIYLDETVPQEKRTGLREIVEEYKGTIVTDPTKASHVVAFDSEIDKDEDLANEEKREAEGQDPEKLYLRTVAITEPLSSGAGGGSGDAAQDRVAMAHWWYWPPSYDEWLPASDVSQVVETEATRMPGMPWVVSYKFIRDVQRHNEWGLEADYAIPDFQTKVALYKSSQGQKADAKRKGARASATSKQMAASGGIFAKRDRRSGTGMNPRSIVTGFYDASGARMRRVVHDGALRVPAHASALQQTSIETIISTWPQKDKNEVLKALTQARNHGLPAVDTLVRPSLDTAEGSTLIVTELSASSSGATVTRNQSVALKNPTADRIRGGGDGDIGVDGDGDVEMHDAEAAPTSGDAQGSLSEKEQAPEAAIAPTNGEGNSAAKFGESTDAEMDVSPENAASGPAKSTQLDQDRDETPSEPTHNEGQLNGTLSSQSSAAPSTPATTSAAASTHAATAIADADANANAAPAALAPVADGDSTLTPAPPTNATASPTNATASPQPPTSGQPSAEGFSAAQSASAREEEPTPQPPARPDTAAAASMTTSASQAAEASSTAATSASSASSEGVDATTQSEEKKDEQPPQPSTVPSSGADVESRKTDDLPPAQAAPKVVALSDDAKQRAAASPSSAADGSAPAETETPIDTPSWYDPNNVSDLEKSLLPEWFNDSASHRTESSYIEARERMIQVARADADKYLTATAIRRCVVGDAGSLLRLHEFLTHWRLINRVAAGESAPAVSHTRYEHQAVARRKRPVGETFWSDGRKDFLAKLVVESSNKKRKVDRDAMADSHENGSEKMGPVRIDWDSVAADVGGGVSGTECQRTFLSLPLASSGDTKPSSDAGICKRAQREEVLRDLIKDVRPEVFKAATKAALEATEDLNEAQNGALVGTIAAKAKERAVAEEETANQLLMQLLDQRMQKMENRVALLDEIEGMLEAERVALELERRDLYTARCRHWFGGGN